MFFRAHFVSQWLLVVRTLWVPGRYYQQWQDIMAVRTIRSKMPTNCCIVNCMNRSRATLTAPHLCSPILTSISIFTTNIQWRHLLAHSFSLLKEPTYASDTILQHFGMRSMQALLTKKRQRHIQLNYYLFCCWCTSMSQLASPQQHAPGSRSQVIAFTRKLRRHPVNAYPELSNIRWILNKLLYLISWPSKCHLESQFHILIFIGKKLMWITVR